MSSLSDSVFTSKIFLVVKSDVSTLVASSNSF